MRRFLRNAGIGVVVVALFVGAASTMAAAKGKSPKGGSTKAPAEQAQRAQQYAYLGVGIESLPAALVSHLPKTFRNGQGVLVAEVASGSPAEKAGVQSQDILMSYDDQKLFSPEQLAKLVRADRAGRKVTLNLIREGKPLHIQVTLGQREAEETGAPTWPFYEPWRWSWRMPGWRMMPGWQMMPGPQAPEGQTKATTPSNEELRWKSFDSMTIKNLGNGQFKAQIQYLNKNGKVESQEFEGTRAQIDKAIAARKDLPTVEQEHLLRGLDIPSGEWVFPSAQMTPGPGLSQHFDQSGRVY